MAGPLISTRRFLGTFAFVVIFVSFTTDFARGFSFVMEMCEAMLFLAIVAELIAIMNAFSKALGW